MNTLYDEARQKFLNAQLPWDTSPIRMALVSSEYAYNPAHTNITDIPQTAVIADAPVPDQTSLSGYATGGQTLFPTLTSPTPVAYVVLYADTGIVANNTLIAYYDNVVGLPFTPAGLDYFFSADVIFGGFFRV